MYIQPTIQSLGQGLPLMNTMRSEPLKFESLYNLGALSMLENHICISVLIVCIPVLSNDSEMNDYYMNRKKIILHKLPNTLIKE